MNVGGFVLLFAALAVMYYATYTIVDFDDISSNPKYVNIISQSYKTKIMLRVHGVNMDPVIGKDIHEYLVTPIPGIGGREIITKDSLNIGSVIRVDKVLLCSNCLLDFIPRIKVQISILSEDTFNKYNVYMGDSFGDVEFLVDQGGAITMNPEHFEKI